jgi:hypothetical protein
MVDVEKGKLVKEGERFSFYRHLNLGFMKNF